MGLPMEYDERGSSVRVRHDGLELRGARIDCRDIPDMLPILATLGTFASGRDGARAHRARAAKESDRVAAMLQLNEMGGASTVHDGRLVARGVCSLAAAQSLVLQRSPHPHVARGRGVPRRAGRAPLTYPNAYRISYPQFLEGRCAASALACRFREPADSGRRRRIHAARSWWAAGTRAEVNARPDDLGDRMKRATAGTSR